MTKPGEGFERVLRVLRRRWVVVLVAALAVPIAAYLVSSSQEEKYTATATLLFESSSANPIEPGRQTATNEALAVLPVVAERTAEKLPDVSTFEILESISASSENNTTDVATISATSTSPQLAARIANAYSRAYIEFRRESEQSQVQQAIDLVERSLSEIPPTERGASQAARLEAKLNSLEVQQALQTGKTQLVQPAGVPSVPSSPKTKRNVVVGIVFGLLLAVALAALLERVDRRVRSVEELEELFGLPLVAQIPRSQALASARPREIAQLTEAEALRALRANMRYFNAGNGTRVILFVSAEPGDGKTTTARALAAIMAEMGDRVVLVEGDLRKGTELRMVGDLPVPGLASALSGVPLNEVLVRVPVKQPGAVDPKWLVVLPSGQAPPNPAELLEGEGMRVVMKTLTDHFDTVVIDTPALGLVSDALALVPFATNVIMIGAVGRTTRDSALGITKQLALLGTHATGLVVTFSDVRREKYY